MKPDASVLLFKTEHTEDSQYDLDILIVQAKTYTKWYPEENKKYANFLKENYDELVYSDRRKPLNFYHKMSKVLNIGRNNVQCRSHHQKMQKKYKHID